MKYLTVLWLFGILIFLDGCSPMYVPNVHNVPMLSRKGEFQGSAYFNGVRGGFDFQTAIAVTNKFGLMANGSLADVQNCESCFTNKHKFAEIGFGYYNFYQEHRSKEVFFGIGTGSSEAFGAAELYADPEFKAKGKYNRIFGQGHYGKRGKKFDSATSLKITGVYFYQYRQFHRGDEGDYNNEEQVNGKNWSVFLEPATTGRIGLFGLENLKLSWQLGFAIPLMPGKKFQHQGAFLSIGLHLNIPPRD